MLIHDLLSLSSPIPSRLYTLSYWSNPPLTFDTRALWRSGLSVRAPECQKQVFQQEAYPAIPYGALLTPKIRPSLGLSPKIGEGLSEIRADHHDAKFHADR